MNAGGIDCGTHACGAGQKCAYNNRCLTFRESGDGLIGGTTWVSTYALNKPSDTTSATGRRAAAEAEQRFFENLRRAGIPKAELIDPREYDFILGVARSSSAFWDLALRVIWDNFSKGRATPELQRAYSLLQGREFAHHLDCHSNGAMICLAAIANGDVRVKGVVRLFGPQITPESLKEWQRLVEKHKFRLEIYYMDHDPVPRISYAAKALLGGANALSAALGANDVLVEVVRQDSLKDMTKRHAPSATINRAPCEYADVHLYSTACHFVGLYQEAFPFPESYDMSPAQIEEMQRFLRGR